MLKHNNDELYLSRFFIYYKHVLKQQNLKKVCLSLSHRNCDKTIKFSKLPGILHHENLIVTYLEIHVKRRKNDQNRSNRLKTVKKKFNYSTIIMIKSTYQFSTSNLTYFKS